MEAATRTDGGGRSPSATRKALTIGAVAKILSREFDDVSISKIRYLEDQKLLSPRRTPGGYRLYSQADVERLRAILRMQRDEFLPLRVIRQELAAGTERPETRSGSAAALRRAVSVDPAKASGVTLSELVDQTGVSPEVIADLEEWRIVQPEKVDGQQMYNDTDREIVKACGELARFGVAGRNLRALRTSADREAALLEQVMAPALRSSNLPRRREALENLETLAASTSNLTHMLLVRDLRKLTGEE
ncbi:MAG TPA: MerR family transcriptional regulator [Solirubrobacterales bacterium]|jgi:DNA-binding transcriptional MerR regulator|nr:MerR family transcriptional regulator [Solirubrobacterales bacterium]